MISLILNMISISNIESLTSIIISTCKLPTKHGLFDFDIHKINNLEIPVLKNLNQNENENVNENVNVRVHDACMTSEVFNSLKCDCDSQLKMSMNYINYNTG